MLRVCGPSSGDSQNSGFLVKSFLPFHVSEASDIAQVKAETVLVLIAHATEREAAIFHTDTAAIPVVAGLHCAVLQKSDVGIKAHCACAAEAALVGRTIGQHYPELMKVQRARNTIGNKNLAWHSQIYIATAKSNPAELVVDQCRTGADSAALEVVIQFPVGIHMCLRSYPKTRDQRREMPRTGEEGNASEVGGCSEHVA